MKSSCMATLIWAAAVNLAGGADPVLFRGCDLQMLEMGNQSVLRSSGTDEQYIASHALVGDKNGLYFNDDRTIAEVKSTWMGTAPVSLAKRSLMQYRADLEAFRREYGGAREMPDIRFFQFGMGSRAKYLFKKGVLTRAPNGPVIRHWDTKESTILPPDYSVTMTTMDGRQIRIVEDEDAVWIEEDGQRSVVPGTQARVCLPSFAGHQHASILRVLHHEILINVIDGLPVPNFYVYKKPWYRDGAMMAMCLKRTGNLAVIRDWILGLREPYDRNNAGETEADNLGQGLYLVSLVSDKKHPLVPTILRELPSFEVKDQQGLYLKGRSDFADHPVYQTKWAKYGLRALGLEDPYTIPAVADSYSSLFWMDFRDQHAAGTKVTDHGFYPYLGWATDHFLGQKLSPISNRDYPLTWEIQASQADYAGMAIIDPIFVERKTSSPHTWHAAEVFLYLLEER